MSRQPRERPADYLADWGEREALAENMVPIVGALHRRGVCVQIYNRSLVNRSSIDIMKMHRFVRQIERNELSEFESYSLLLALKDLPLRPSVIDLGQLTVRHMALAAESPDLEIDQGAWLREQLTEVIGEAGEVPPPRDVVIYGFGRIGRLMARLLVEEGGSQLRLRAVCIRKRGAPEEDLIKRASLLRRDSVHGSFRGTIRIDEELESLVINGNPVRFIDVDGGPDSIDYESLGISNALMIDSTGVWRDRTGLERHLKCPGIDRVLLTAPGRGDLPNLVYGINHETLGDGEKVVSAASCTTNAIVPLLKIVHDEFEVMHGHIETVHAYTNDQNLTDNYHDKSRRGRSAPMNMVITETGAASAVAKALPQLSGRITGNAIRVPTPNVSLAILNLELGRPVDRKTVNEHLRQQALHSRYSSILDYTASPDAASTDFVGSHYAVALDSQATIAEGQRCVLYAWYDNEYGYCWQLFRMAQAILGVERLKLPADRV
ncbi:MAG: glyceraldehyde-3-phosphate dehydrogenase [Gammaproteobacteria bacterium AqS3]|nr:glyceraldehyde-3-phosphate dehydrogenase [Gammaproteobacteria bacterium AqS3]